MGKVGDFGKGTTTSTAQVMSSTTGFPNGPDGAAYLSRVSVYEPTPKYIRGYLRGLYQFMHPISNITDNDVFSGTGDFAGRTFLLIKQSGNAGAYVIETTNWDTSV